MKLLAVIPQTFRKGLIESRSARWRSIGRAEQRRAQGGTV